MNGRNKTQKIQKMTGLMTAPIFAAFLRLFAANPNCQS